MGEKAVSTVIPHESCFIHIYVYVNTNTGIPMYLCMYIMYINTFTYINIHKYMGMIVVFKKFESHIYCSAFCFT